MADLALAVQRGTAPELVTTLACLFFVAFGIKAAVFPLFFWLPASYHTPPVAVSAVFAGLLTKVGVYALVRAFTLVFTGDTALTHGLILAVAALTMVTGVLGPPPSSSSGGCSRSTSSARSATWSSASASSRRSPSRGRSST